MTTLKKRSVMLGVLVSVLACATFAIPPASAQDNDQRHPMMMHHDRDQARMMHHGRRRHGKAARMRRALKALRRARYALDHSAHVYHGYRVKALSEVNLAIKDVQAGLRSARK